MAVCCARIAEVARCILPVEPSLLAAHSKRKLGLITRDTIAVCIELREYPEDYADFCNLYPRDIWNFAMMRFRACAERSTYVDSCGRAPKLGRLSVIEI